MAMTWMIGLPLKKLSLASEIVLSPKEYSFNTIA